MKKAWILALVLGVTSGVALAADVMSVNVVAFTKVNVVGNGTFTLLATPFDAIDTADDNLLGVFGTNSLIRNTRATGADQVWLYDSSIPMWNVYWQQPDGLFYDGYTLAPSNAPVGPGVGIIIQSPSVSSDHEIAFMGQVVTVSTQKIDIVSQWNVIGYPFSSAVDIQDTGFAASGATPSGRPTGADQLWFLKADGTFKSYYLNTTGKWNDGDDLTEATNVVVPLGQGFMYQAIAGFQWAETNKYLNNL